MDLGERVIKLMDAAAVGDCYKFSAGELAALVQQVSRDCATVSLRYYHPRYSYQHRCGQDIARAIESKYGVDNDRISTDT